MAFNGLKGTVVNLAEFSLHGRSIQLTVKGSRNAKKKLRIGKYTFLDVRTGFGY